MAASAEALQLAERLAAQMAQRWQAGERPLAEEYLSAHPQLAECPEAAAELIYEEVCQRRAAGQEVDPEDILRRFPRWRGPLQVLLQCQQMLESTAAGPPFPVAGETIAGFRLLAELGRGSQGRAFLATQAALADRPVVLKISGRDTDEHLSLARLQHTHIVPLYSAQEDPVRGLRILCMPYFGGATLARLLESLQARPPKQRSGRDLLDALRQAQAHAPVAMAVGGPACQFLEAASYGEVICWLGACLAEALHYAHGHGLLHLDLKPSNVLWAAHGQPLLLDLHLAREPLAAGEAAPPWLGGTAGYMAPEQQAALAAVPRGQRVPLAVDGRADVYSLGVVLYEALAGVRPAAGQRPAQQLRQLNPHVPHALAGLLQRCLAHDPRDRYPDAAALAADLRRHLADQPLQGVAVPLRMQLGGRWRRRRYAAAVLALFAVLGCAALLGIRHVGRQREQARTALQVGQECLAQGKPAAALDAFREGLSAAGNSPFSNDLAEQLRQQMDQARLAQAAGPLHLFVEHLHGLDGVEALPPAARTVEAHCAALWEQRQPLVDALKAAAPPLRGSVESDLQDLAILWSDLRIRLAAPSQVDEARREALAVLTEAQRLLGPSAVLQIEQRSQAAVLAHQEPAGAAEEVPGAREEVALGRIRFRAGDLAGALHHFDRALELEPQGLWPHFYKGRCAFRLGRHEDAVLAFTACVALAPQRAWCWYNRGLAFEALGQTDRALADYDRALRLDPALALAALNRGMLYHRRGRSAEALADLQSALDHGAPPAAVHYDLALVHLARGDTAAARHNLQQALARDPSHRDARSLLAGLPASP